MRDEYMLEHLKMPAVRHIGEKLVAARTKHGFTQAQVAEMLSVSQEMIAQVERGNRSPGKSLAVRIREWIANPKARREAPRGARGSYFRTTIPEKS